MNLCNCENPESAFPPSSVLLQKKRKKHKKTTVMNNPPNVNGTLEKQMLFRIVEGVGPTLLVVKAFLSNP